MKIKPFKGLRPVREMAGVVASHPYDVLDSEEARAIAHGNPYSFLNVVKPEITLPENTDPYAQEVYDAGKSGFLKLVQEGIFFQEKTDCFYLYELTMACAAVDDYLNGKIKKHELTRYDKEHDRKQHVQVSMLNAEPVFLAYRAFKPLNELQETVKHQAPEYDFTADDGIRHRLWVINNVNLIRAIKSGFEKIPFAYVADGHHRTAAAASVGEELKNANPDHTGMEEYNYFLAVFFPDDQLHILDYNRAVRDLNGHDTKTFLDLIAGPFQIKKTGNRYHKPEKLHEMCMYLDGDWYCLNARPHTYDDGDPIGGLDVTILSKQILEPILDIHDLRNDNRIDFIGGVRGLEELQRRVDSGEMAVAFALFPVSMQQLMMIADNGLIMPPKVTWFEPKLRSGLVVHSL